MSITSVTRIELKRIADTLERIEEHLKKDNGVRYYPQIPQQPLTLNLNNCPKCNMVLTDVMGFVCQDGECPIQPKVTIVSVRGYDVNAESNRGSAQTPTDRVTTGGDANEY